MQVGDAVNVSVDGIPRSALRRRVESLSPASGAQFALLPPDNATGNFARIVQRIPVKITFDPSQQGWTSFARACRRRWRWIAAARRAAAPATNT